LARYLIEIETTINTPLGRYLIEIETTINTPLGVP
jgi:hypothetical protein